MSFYNIYQYNQFGGFDKLIFNNELEQLQSNNKKIKYIENTINDVIKNHKNTDIFVLIPFIDNLYNYAIKFSIDKQLWNDFLNVYSLYIVNSDNSLSTVSINEAITKPMQLSIEKQFSVSLITILDKIILNKEIILKIYNKYIKLKLLPIQHNNSNNYLYNLLKGIKNASIEQNIEHWINILNISPDNDYNFFTYFINKFIFTFYDEHLFFVFFKLNPILNIFYDFPHFKQSIIEALDIYLNFISNNYHNFLSDSNKRIIKKYIIKNISTSSTPKLRISSHNNKIIQHGMNYDSSKYSLNDVKEASITLDEYYIKDNIELNKLNSHHDIMNVDKNIVKIIIIFIMTLLNILLK